MRMVFILLTLALMGCGQHVSQTSSYLQTGDSFSGKDPKTPEEILLNAIARDDLDLVTKTIRDGFDVNKILTSGRTALIETVVQNRIRIMLGLIQLGAEKGLKDKMGKSAFDWAVELAGTDPNGENLVTRAMLILDESIQSTQQKALMKFSGRGSSDPIMRLLKEVGVSPNFIDEDGNTPLSLAIRKGKLTSVQVLAAWTDCPDENIKSTCLRLTATDLNLPTAEGLKPLTLARQLGANEIVSLLVEAGAKE